MYQRLSWLKTVFTVAENFVNKSNGGSLFCGGCPHVHNVEHSLQSDLVAVEILFRTIDSRLLTEKCTSLFICELLYYQLKQEIYK